MHGNNKFASIRLKISLIYFLLILLTALIIYILISVQVRFLFAALIAILITGVLGFFLTNRFSKNMSILMAKAEQMLDGDFDQAIKIDSGDEVEQMSDILDSLRCQLNETVTEISNDKNKLETILKHMADGLIVVDLTGHIIHANPASRLMLKISKDDIERRHFNNIILKYNEYLTLENIMEKTEEEAFKDTFVYAGTTYEVRCDRFKDESNNDKGIIIFLQDITERQKLDDMQVDFIANISHELKTPLTTVKSYTETLLDGGLESPEASREFLDIIASEADRMDRLVKDLLQLSRLDYKQQKWYKREGDLISLVRTAVKKVELTAKSKEQQTNLLFDDEMVLMVDMDRDRIEQVILKYS